MIRLSRKKGRRSTTVWNARAPGHSISWESQGTTGVALQCKGWCTVKFFEMKKKADLSDIGQFLSLKWIFFFFLFLLVCNNEHKYFIKHKTHDSCPENSRKMSQGDQEFVKIFVFWSFISEEKGGKMPHSTQVHRQLHPKFRVGNYHDRFPCVTFISTIEEEVWKLVHSHS